MYAAYALPIFDFTVPLAHIPGLTVQACVIGDQSCKTAAGLVSGPTDQMIPAGPGGSLVSAPVYTIGMTYGTNAYLRMTAPDYLTHEYYLGGQLIGDRDGAVIDGAPLVKGLLPLVKGLPVTPIRATAANDLATAIGETRVPDDAIIIMRAIDCQGNFANDVTLAVDLAPEKSGTPFTFLSGMISISTGGPIVTNQDGLAGFANVPPDGSFRNVSVEGIAPNGTHYGRINVTIRQGQITGAEIRPDTGFFGR